MTKPFKSVSNSKLCCGGVEFEFKGPMYLSFLPIDSFHSKAEVLGNRMITTIFYAGLPHLSAYHQYRTFGIIKRAASDTLMTKRAQLDILLVKKTRECKPQGG